MSKTQTLDHIKHVNKFHIDYAAESVRMSHLTSGLNQQMVYVEKAEQAIDFIAAYPDVDAQDFPLLAASSEALGIPMMAAANQILQKKQQWIAISAQVELIRLTGKREIDLAETIEQVKTIKNQCVQQLDSLRG